MGDIIVIGIIALVLGLIVFRLIKNKKEGKNSCCPTGCSNCPSSKTCIPETPKEME